VLVGARGAGGPFSDTLKGLAGADALEGRGGPDDLIGGTDNDSASYEHAGKDVTASLANPATNTGAAKGDSDTSIENLTGSRFADKLTGNDKANHRPTVPH
jgi:serralysin